MTDKAGRVKGYEELFGLQPSRGLDELDTVRESRGLMK